VRKKKKSGETKNFFAPPRFSIIGSTLRGMKAKMHNTNIAKTEN